eukprot:scaffold24519_cov74-Skeletonema_menzelii.AAC.1
MEVPAPKKLRRRLTTESPSASERRESKEEQWQVKGMEALSLWARGHIMGHHRYRCRRSSRCAL